MDCPGGLGPWFSSFFLNVKQQKTHLTSHTAPHLLLDVLNKNEGVCVWVLMLKIGPFESWEDSVSFWSLWKKKCSSSTSVVVMETGIELFYQYATRYNLTCWAQALPLDEKVVQTKKKKSKVLPYMSEKEMMELFEMDHGQVVAKKLRDFHARVDPVRKKIKMA
jgi:hypothetical protein